MPVKKRNKKKQSRTLSVTYQNLIVILIGAGLGIIVYMIEYKKLRDAQRNPQNEIELLRRTITLLKKQQRQMQLQDIINDLRHRQVNLLKEKNRNLQR